MSELVYKKGEGWVYRTNNYVCSPVCTDSQGQKFYLELRPVGSPIERTELCELSRLKPEQFFDFTDGNPWVDAFKDPTFGFTGLSADAMSSKDIQTVVVKVLC